MPSSTIKLTETPYRTRDDDVVLRAEGAAVGLIAVGYRSHKHGPRPTWYLRIDLAPVISDALGAWTPQPLIINGFRMPAGVIHHQVHPHLPTWPEHYSIGTDPATGTPSLTPLATSVLKKWHSVDRLTTVRRTALTASAPHPHPCA